MQRLGRISGAYLDLIETLSKEAASWTTRPNVDTDSLGPIPRVNVSVKVSSLSARIRPADTAGSIERLVAALEPILLAARANDVLVNFDMEQYELKDLTIELFQRCCERYDFAAGLAMQAYLRSGEADARRLIDWAQRSGREVTVRLIKGAYWDYETIHAEMMGWPCPVWGRKRETDACFERMAEIFLSQMPQRKGEGGVKLAIGSHNVRSIAAVMAMAEQRGLPANAIEIQMLYGMADALKDVLAEKGRRVRVYAPVGEMIPGMAYLVRRLLENTSNESWLRAGFAEDAPAEVLLASPHGDRTWTSVTPEEGFRDDVRGAALEKTGPRSTPADGAAMARRHRASAGTRGVGDGQPFLNEPLRDFSNATARVRFANAIKRSAVPEVSNDTTVEQARDAVSRAADAFSRWRDTPAVKRAGVLIKAGRIMPQPAG